MAHRGLPRAFIAIGLAAVGLLAGAMLQWMSWQSKLAGTNREAVEADQHNPRLITSSVATRFNSRSGVNSPIYTASVVISSEMAVVAKTVSHRIREIDGVPDSWADGTTTMTIGWEKVSYPDNSLYEKMLSITTRTAYVLSWLPPGRTSGSFAEGGGQVPQRSEVQVVLASSSSISSGTVVTISRDWKYLAWLHVPYTDMPKGQSVLSERRLLKSDIDWLNRIAKDWGQVAVAMPDKHYIDADVLALIGAE